MGRLERQKADVDAALEKAAKNPTNAFAAGEVMSKRNNYLDELSKNLDEAGQTQTEKAVFEKTPLLEKQKNWWD